VNCFHGAGGIMYCFHGARDLTVNCFPGVGGSRYLRIGCSGDLAGGMSVHQDLRPHLHDIYNSESLRGQTAAQMNRRGYAGYTAVELPPMTLSEDPATDQQLLVLRLIVLVGSIAVVILESEYLRLMSNDCSCNRDNTCKPL
jgi:hypothetical protein